MKTSMNELYHHGIIGQKWGKKNGPPYPLDASAYTARESKAASIAYYRESDKPIKVNSDGSYSIPKGFKFNRIGKNTMEVRTNQTGGLYVSYGKADAARYVKIYGPDLINRLLHNTREAVQHISVTSPIKLASDDQFVSLTGEFLKNNKDIASKLQSDSFYGAGLNSRNRKLNDQNLDRMISDPKSNYSKQMAWMINATFVDYEDYSSETKRAYDYFRSKGFDAIPDVHDTWGGTSETAMIVINPKKVKVSETTVLTKEVFDNGRAYVKTLERLHPDKSIKEL